MTAVPRLLVAAAAVALAAPAHGRTWEQVYPLQRQQTFSFEDQGVTVTVTPPPPAPEDRDISDEEFEATYKDATITVQFPALPLYRVQADC